MNLRGKENRKKFVDTHSIKPLGHLKLLKGQTKYSVSGSKLTDQYYSFIYKEKNNKYAKEKSFYCGYKVAKDLLKLTSQEDLPLFNPLKLETSDKFGNCNNVNERNEVKRKPNKIYSKLYDAINLFETCEGKNISGTMGKIKLEVHKNLYTELGDTNEKGKVKGINTIISQLSPHKTLKELMNDFSKENAFKNYDFTLLNVIIEEYGETSHFE